MITDKTLDFLHALKANNTREWFHAHRKDYDSAYGDFFDTVVQVVKSISSFDPSIAEATPDPKSCIMRIYRDIRFSKDKTPYKTGFFAFVSKGGWKAPNGGYYLHLEPGGSFAGGGLYMPEPHILDLARRAIDARYDEWLSKVTARELIAWFPDGIRPSGETKRPPKGYEASNPAIAYLKFKGYYTQRFLKDSEATAPDFIENLESIYRAVWPVIEFLNSSMTDS
jgi:uncharacterized protein (TIGR02453 family)